MAQPTVKRLVASATVRDSNVKRKSETEDDEKPDESSIKRGKQIVLDKSRNCPYLDTINRNVLDFDFEKLCSVSLSRINVYACLVCGKYFQGRGQNTHAYTHSVEVGHHVYLNLLSLKFYCLPDNYEIIDSALDDIKYVLQPTFTPEQVKGLDKNDRLSRAIDGTTYLPGIVGLNNIKANDYCNVMLQALSHVPPLRNYFLRHENYGGIRPTPGDIMFLLVQRFGELLRKLWNPRNFKAHVSPHEMLQSVVLCSKKKFQITEQGDPIAFLSWFLNALHLALGGNASRSSSIIYKTFRGKLKVFSRKIPPVEMEEHLKQELMLTDEYQEKAEMSPFLYLTLDLPPPPLFKDEFRENIIPQVPLYNIMAKFNGVLEKEYKTYKDSTMKRFEITELPPYLLLYIRRFTKNTFYIEKNPTIVNFPIKNIDLSEYLCPEVRAIHKETCYDLLANIVHDGEPASGKGTYRVHILHKVGYGMGSTLLEISGVQNPLWNKISLPVKSSYHGTGKWFELQDLHVIEILPQMITLSEAYIQIYERRKMEPINKDSST